MLSIFSYFFLREISFLTNLLPEEVALWLGRRLGSVAYYLDREHRKIALQNLTIAFGQEKSQSEKRKIAERTFQNLGMAAIEFFRIPGLDAEDFKKKVKIEGLDDALRLLDKKKGGLLLLGHFGNWELMGIMSKVIGNSILVIAKPIKNERIDRWITGIRKAAGLEIIPPENAARKVIKALNQNRVVGILIDQRAKRSRGIWADFFGRKAPTTPGLAVLALKTGAPVVPVFMVRDGFQKHRLLIQKPVEIIHTGDFEKDVEANTQRFNQVIETMIREYPDQWFWVHQRWERKKRKSHHR